MLFILFIFVFIIILAYYRGRNTDPAFLDDLSNSDTYYNTTHAYIVKNGESICFPHTTNSLAKIKKYKEQMGTD